MGPIKSCLCLWLTVDKPILVQSHCRQLQQLWVHSAKTRRWYSIALSIASDSYIFFPPVLMQCSLSPGEKTMCVLFWTKRSSLVLSSLNSQEFLYSLQFTKKRHLWLRFKVALSMDIKNTYIVWGYVNVPNSSSKVFLVPLTSQTCLFDRFYNSRN